MGPTTPVPLPLKELQSRVSHLQAARAKGRERGKRWHGVGTGLGAEVGGCGMKRGGGLRPGDRPRARALVTSS